MPSSYDTLDIKPLPHQHSNSGELRPDQTVVFSHDPIAAAEARRTIAGLAANPQPAPAVESLPLPHPVSPVAEAAKAKPHPKRYGFLPSPIRPIVTALATFLLILTVFKLPIILSQIGYLSNRPATITSPPPVAETVPPNPTISIPKINVNAPVVYEPSTAEAAVQKALQSGIEHYGNTPVPGQAGNAVFFGHSSNDWWEPGNYKFVFVLLDKLVVGDTFSINYNSVKYVYKVTNVKVVEPNDFSVLGPTSAPTATLITCTPPGTSWKRLIVQANQINPDPNHSQSVGNAQTSASGNVLPSNPPSLVDQLSSAWKSLTHGITSLFSHSGSNPAPTSPEIPNNQTLPAT